jgi:hypothetical protein
MNNKSLLEEFAKQYAPRTLDLRKTCFAEQLRFIEDPAPFSTAICSRRAGKSTACAADLLFTAQSFPGTTCLYLTITRSQAKRNIWPVFKAFIKEHNLSAVMNESELSVKLANGSTIYCSGAKDTREVEKFLGFPIKKVYIDEAQSFRSYLLDLIDRVLAPALLDHAGVIRLIGTPGCVPTGPFWDLSQHKAWAHHHWTFFQNPYISLKSGQTHQFLLQRELDRRGITTVDPSIRRDYFGEWVTDENSLVLKYNPQVNHYDTLPKGNYTYILGVDLGFNDADALSVLAWSESDPVTYLVHEVVKRKQTISDLVKEIETLQGRYDISKMMVDAGGLGKKIAESLISRFKVPLIAADKARKMENLELLNDALRTGRFKAKASSAFAEDCYKVEWDRDKTTPEKRVISDRYHSDIIDAVLYSFKESPAYAYSPPIVGPKWGSPAWMRKEEENMFEHELEKAKEQSQASQEFTDSLYGARKW